MDGLNGARPHLLDRMSTLADATRNRLLLVLERREVAVTELVSVLQLPQSTVSRHLKILADQSWILARREGTSRMYSFEPAQLEPEARRLWALAREAMQGAPEVREDLRRLETVLAERRSRSQEFFTSAAGEWDRVRRRLFGRHSEAEALLGLLPETWTVGDLGCGTGGAAAALAPFVRRVVAVDGSDAMLDAARRRLAPHPNVEVHRGELESLPLDEGELDAALLTLVLHHVPEPQRILAEVARVLAPGGRILIVDMAQHSRESYRAEMGHVWLGFAPEQLSDWLAGAGFVGVASRPLPPDPDAKGPSLLAVTAQRSPSVLNLNEPRDRARRERISPLRSER